ncbi:MAG: YidC/Oxa1 family membrane protein insertase [Oscillospiraceae bacterium]|jgi:YidC/Oxa1 family membrane protein insertase|nr:YidC/Oxa1 family membrane protein insertase [Oscillospiraceae bacterium]MCI9289363.1 YidC/Oxa1 family membrane protein insertase [Oscillospiraceae bacterium]
MDIWQILMTPFSLLLKLFCQVFNSYGIALILFTVVVKVILFPLHLKGKKSMIKMNVVNSQLQEIQKRCGNDREKYNQEVQKFYAENNVNPMGGCGWSMIPMLILWPLYAIIRRPLKYMMNLTEAATTAVGKALGWADFTPVGYNELTLGSMMKAGNLSAAKDAAAAAGVSAAGMFVINFDFFGIDLSLIPQLKFWEGGLSWGSIGLFLLPVISAALSLVSTLIMQKTNQMSKDQAPPKMNLSLLLLGPGMSLFIGFGMPAGMCVYWIANSLLMMVQEVICGAMLRKDYEAAQKEMEIQAAKAKEAEKERRRIAAEKKAAAIAAGKDPKKAHQKKAKEPGMDLSASREGLRAYARGRAYDPNRYPITPYYDPNGPAKPAQEEPEEPAPEKAEDEVKIVSLGEKVPIEAVPSAGQSTEEKPAGDSGDYEEPYAGDDGEN